MPNIETYSNQMEGPQPTDRGSSAFAMEGRRVGAFYHQIGESVGGAVARVGEDVQKHETRVELMQQAADISDLHAKYVDRANKITATTKPEDIEAAMSGLRDDLNKDLDNLGQKYTTDGAQDVFIRARAGISDDIFSRTSTDAARSVATGAVANVEEMRNRWSSAASQDGTGFENYINMSGLYIDGLVHPAGGGLGLPMEQAISLKKEVAHDIALAAARNLASSNPAGYKKLASDGRFDKYLTGEEQEGVNHYADEQARATLAGQRAQEEEVRRQQKDFYNTKMNDLVARITQPDGTFKVGPAEMKEAVDISMLPGAGAEGRAGLEFMHHAAKPEAATQVSDPATYEALRQRISSSSTHPLTEIDLKNAFSSGNLSYKDYTDFHNLIKPDADPQATRNREDVNRFLDTFKTAITGGGASSPAWQALGARQYYNFQIDVTNRFNAGIQKGLTADEMLRDVKSPNYLGNLVPHYVPTQDQLTAAAADPTGFKLTQPSRPANAGTAAPRAVVPASRPLPGQPTRLPNESPEQFLARTHKG